MPETRRPVVEWIALKHFHRGCAVPGILAIYGKSQGEWEYR